MKTWFWPRTRALLVLSVLGLLVYVNAIFHPFVHDDTVFVQMNPNIARWDNLGESFQAPVVPIQTMKIVTPYYRPLLEIFYRLQYLIFGMNPAGFHLFNILLHILNAFLVFLLALRLRVRKVWAFAVALIFLVHPVQTEAVACVSGISNLVVTGLVLGTLLAYAQARAATGWRRWTWPAGAVSIFACALLSKEQAVVAPALVVLYEFLWPATGGGAPDASSDVRSRTADLFRFLRRWLLSAVFFWLVGGYLLWRMVLFPGFLSGSLENPGELVLRLWAVPKTLLMYIGLILWPAGLHYYRSIDILSRDLAAVFGFLACALFILAACASMPERYRRWAWFGLGWFLVTILPVANIVPLVNEYSLVLAAEHFLYLPIIGFLIFLMAVAGWLFSTMGGVLAPRLRRLVFALIAAVLSVLTIAQNRMWSDEVTLFERTLKYQPGFARVHLLLANAYLVRNRIPEALAEYSTGLQIMQGYVKKAGHSKAVDVYRHYVKAAHFDRGTCYLAMGDIGRANEEFLASLAVRMDYRAMPEIRAQDSLTASNLGLNFIRLGNRSDAKKCFIQAVQLDGKNYHALNNMGAWYMAVEDRVMARRWFEKALKVNPQFTVAWQNLQKTDSFVK